MTDSKGHVLYNKDDATKGKFAFTTEEYDMFEICFETKVPHGTLVVCFVIDTCQIFIAIHTGFMVEFKLGLINFKDFILPSHCSRKCFN